ncbi:MAG: ABC transporter permease [Syntrophobacteraceae bacterium]|jgi:lipopolysaccharide transport system permease protein
MLNNAVNCTSDDLAKEQPVIRRQARPGWVAIDFAELWRYRELVVFYAVRDIRVRYKQTLLGVAWAVLQPVLTMLVFSIFFGTLARVPSDGIPYPIFSYCGLVPWQLFAYALTQSSNRIVEDAGVITKVYFPRLIVPLASVIAGLVDFSIAFAVLMAMMFYYGIPLSITILTLPLFTLIGLVAALAVGLWLSALNVRYRDVRYTIPFLAQFWLFVTPVAYSSSLVPAKWQALYAINPMVGVVNGFRWALLGKTCPNPMVSVSLAATAVLLIGGLYYFRRMEKSFADII